jgi:hypothetical protein
MVNCDKIIDIRGSLYPILLKYGSLELKISNFEGNFIALVASTIVRELKEKRRCSFITFHFSGALKTFDNLQFKPSAVMKLGDKSQKYGLTIDAEMNLALYRKILESELAR